MVDLYADMFELAPVALWLEDYSDLKRLLDQWRAEGVADLRAHLRERPERIAMCSQRIKVLRVNRHALTLYGARDQQHLVDNLHLLLRDDMLDAYVEELGQLWEGRLRLASQTINYTLAGERMVMVFNASILPGHETHWDRVLVALEDVSARERSERQARSLFEHSPVPLLLADLTGVRRGVDEGRPGWAECAIAEAALLDANQRALELFEAADPPALMTGLRTAAGGELCDAFSQLLGLLAQGEPLSQREAATRSLGGRALHVVLQLSVLPGHERHWDRALISITDITERKQAEAAVAYLGTHDALTGLRNRAFFGAEVARLDAEGPWPLTVLVTDVDGLKAVNDALGHAAGDELLRAAAQVLAQAIVPPMTVSRMGGDEFVVLMPGSDASAGEALLQRLQRDVASVPAGPGGAPVSLSIGAATGSAGEPVAVVMQRADLQMYRAKHARYAARGRERRGAGPSGHMPFGG